MASGSRTKHSYHNSSQGQAQSSGTSNMNYKDSISKAIAQYTADARLHAVFEQSVH
uniref:Isoform 6 of Phytochrome B1 n=1 Tax=Solanum lycopersicum TaxID=4081 RepID=Q9ZS62-6|nr:phytochrome B1 [Solanum lycopersicum]